MQLSPRTVTILKNFAGINKSIAFRPGNVIKTIDKDRTLFAIANVADDIPRTFALFDLSEFLQILTSYPSEDATIQFEEKYLIVSPDHNQTRIPYGNESLMVLPPERKVIHPEETLKFTLTEANLKEVLRRSRIRSFPQVAFVCEDNMLTFRGMDVKDLTRHDTQADLGACASDDFTVTFNIDKLQNLLPMDYEVSIAAVPSFAGTDVTFYVTNEEKHSS